MIEGGCVKTGPSMFGECPFHPGNSMLDCGTCKLLKLQAPEEPARRETDKPYEYVDHPKHYNEHPAGIECIDVIEHMTHNVGAAVKYLWRTGLKPGEGYARDLDKAIWYINREKERLAKAKK